MFTFSPCSTDKKSHANQTDQLIPILPSAGPRRSVDFPNMRQMSSGSRRFESCCATFVKLLLCCWWKACAHIHVFHWFGGKKNSNSNVFLTFQSVLDAKKKTMGWNRRLSYWGIEIWSLISCLVQCQHPMVGECQYVMGQSSSWATKDRQSRPVEFHMGLT